MKRLSVILFAVVLSSVSFGEIRYCEKGTKNEHSHFSSHDVPLAKGVRVKQKGPVGYSCKTNDHPLVVWSRSFNGWRVDFTIDVRPIDRKKSDLYVKWIKADPKWRSPVSLSVARGIPRLAEEVWVLGYPIPKTLGRSIKYGEGVVSAHEGMQGDAKEFSVTAPIRPGSSGGPVFDASGRVCGIMSSTLKAQLILKLHGHVAPESNFAVKVQYVRDLLKKHGVSCDEAEARPLPKGRADAVESATKAVVLLNSASSVN